MDGQVKPVFMFSVLGDDFFYFVLSAVLSIGGADEAIELLADTIT